MRVIAFLAGVCLAANGAAEPLNYDTCEKIQDSREYAHCIASLGSGAEKRAPAPRAEPSPSNGAPASFAPAAQLKPGPEVRQTTKPNGRGAKIAARSAARGYGRTRVVIGPSQRPPQRVATSRRASAKSVSARGKRH